MTEPTYRKAYYPALDGLRGIAILLVVLLHNFGFMNYFFFGWLGVDLFFVLSGFLITQILVDTVGRPHYLRNFYVRRMLRIFPLYYLLLIVFLLILPLVRPGSPDVAYYTSHQGWLWTYLQNWLFVFHPQTGSPVLQHTWSLAVEEQFYLLWPIVILVLKTPKRLFIAAFLLLLLVGVCRYVVWINHVANLEYDTLYTFTRIDGICIGAMVALLPRFAPKLLERYTFLIVLLMAAVNFIFYFINDSHRFTLPYLAFLGYTTFAFLFGLLVWEAIRPGHSPLQKILSIAPLRFFGRISYGLYVLHWPVYILFFSYLKNGLNKAGWFSAHQNDLLSAIAVTLMAVVGSIISFRLVETPFLRLKKHYAS